SGAPRYAPANYGGAASDAFSDGVAAVRQLELDVASGVLTVANGRFDTHTLTFAIPAGAPSSLSYRVVGMINIAGKLGLGGLSTTGASTTGTLSTVGNQAILTIPIKYTLTMSLASS